MTLGPRTCSSPTSPGATAPPAGATRRASIPVISEPTASSLLGASARALAIAGAFGDAVAVAQWQSEFNLDSGFQRNIERRTSDRQPAKLAAGQLLDSGKRLVLKKPLISGWHAEHQRDAIIGDRGDERSGGEARHQIHSGAGHQRRDQDARETHNVRDRQHAVG